VSSAKGGLNPRLISSTPARVRRKTERIEQELAEITETDDGRQTLEAGCLCSLFLLLFKF
jgi:hypothetical protein